MANWSGAYYQCRIISLMYHLNTAYLAIFVSTRAALAYFVGCCYAPLLVVIT